MTPSLEVTPSIDNSTFNHIPVRGFQTILDVYNKTQSLVDKPDVLIFASEEPITFEEVADDHDDGFYRLLIYPWGGKILKS